MNRETKRALGFCVECHDTKSIDGWRCQDCFERNRIANRNRYRLKHGIPLTEPYQQWGRPRKYP
jgi:hypothetical protein